MDLQSDSIRPSADPLQSSAWRSHWLGRQDKYSPHGVQSTLSGIHKTLPILHAIPAGNVTSYWCGGHANICRFKWSAWSRLRVDDPSPTWETKASVWKSREEHKGCLPKGSKRKHMIANIHQRNCLREHKWWLKIQPRKTERGESLMTCLKATISYTRGPQNWGSPYSHDNGTDFPTWYS